MATLVVIELEDEDDIYKTQKGMYIPIVEVIVKDKNGNVLEQSTVRQIRKAEMEEILRLPRRFMKKSWLKPVLHLDLNR